MFSGSSPAGRARHVIESPQTSSVARVPYAVPLMTSPTSQPYLIPRSSHRIAISVQLVNADVIAECAGMAVGIDFGTTNSAVAVAEGKEVRLVPLQGAP